MYESQLPVFYIPREFAGGTQGIWQKNIVYGIGSSQQPWMYYEPEQNHWVQMIYGAAHAQPKNIWCYIAVDGYTSVLADILTMCCIATNADARSIVHATQKYY